VSALGTPYTYWVCVDCYYAHNGIAFRGNPDCLPLSLITGEVTSGLVSAEHNTPCGSFDSAGGDFLGGECECEQIIFTWAPCDGCGSHLGGGRDALTVWCAS
jgi:hypothetical protein